MWVTKKRNEKKRRGENTGASAAACDLRNAENQGRSLGAKNKHETLGTPPVTSATGALPAVPSTTGHCYCHHHDATPDDSCRYRHAATTHAHPLTPADAPAVRPWPGRVVAAAAAPAEPAGETR